jgi:preprotein translocase subunit SecA
MSIVNVFNAGLRKVFGSRNDRLVKGFRRQVEKVNALEHTVRPLTDPQLRDKAQDLRRRVTSGQVRMVDVVYEALAVMREATDRNIGIRNIFNPEHQSKFDPRKLKPEALAMYQEVQAKIAEIPPQMVLGSEVPIEGWMNVDIPPALYEAVRDIYPESRPPFRARPFDVQLIGGLTLYEGKIAEMKTGEGKTIVAPLACFLACVEGLKCHVVTVNDYLVQRDRDWVFPAFHRLGFTVGAIHPFHMQPAEAKQRAYLCDVLYGTNSELGFDYLRDNMKLTTEEQVQKHRDFCIVDEIDSILIDEARTPLIISGSAHDDAPQYIKANQVAEQLKAFQQRANAATLAKIKEPGFIEAAAKRSKQPVGTIEKIIHKFRDLGPDFIDDKEADMIGHTQYYVVKKEQKQAHMTPLGVDEAQKIVGTRFYVVGNDMAWDHLINNAIRAHSVYEKDREYVVQNGEVIIVDEFTGRLMIGRQWSDGLHQAVEAKEARHGVKIKEETQTLATITIQNFFKLYKRLAGMTGTAITEAHEFHEIYKLDVVVIPTNVPVVRQDSDDLIFLTENAKWNAIIEEIREKHEAGRPVLVGTTSVEKSQVLSQLLTKKYNIEHEVLNAKQHEREAHIVAKAGQQFQDKRGRTVGNVTIATNMAGRGTDIKLTPEVRDAGGLHIVGTERHESRRIDNQLRGRAGRQGDPGSSRFFISMEDDLMKMFAGKATMRALAMLGMQESDAIEHKWITKSVERAQRKVEERNFQIRKNLLEYDEVMEYQRNSFYGTRQAVLEGRHTTKIIFDYIAESIEDAVGKYLAPHYVEEQVADAVRTLMGVNISAKKLRGEKLDDVRQTIIYDAKTDVRQEIEINVGEYMSDDLPPEEWDVNGLSQWAETRGANLRPSVLREMTPAQVVDKLTEIAHQAIENKPLEPLEKFFEPTFPQRELAEWARAKFGLELTVDELTPNRGERADEAQQRIAELIYTRAEQAYNRREIEYPVRFILDYAFQYLKADRGMEGAQLLIGWLKQRFDLTWTPNDLQGKTFDDFTRILVGEAEQWRGPKLEAWLDSAFAGNPDEATLRQRVLERWGVELTDADFTETDANGLVHTLDRREVVKTKALGQLRLELAQLERFVLLQILDQAWKDHLYAIDQLKDSIGLRGFAEKDPKIEYKAEGSRYFQSMLQSVRDKVTDMIFRAQLTPNVEMRSQYNEQHAEHQQIENTGVNAAAAAASTGTDQQQEDLAAANRTGAAERPVVKTIVNRNPEIGRNDPCPCGSGKKYKKCCGANAV